jgi:hypothetical protein
MKVAERRPGIRAPVTIAISYQYAAECSDVAAVEMERSGVTQSALRGAMALNADGLARGIEETRCAGLMLVATRGASPGRIQARRSEPHDTSPAVSVNKPR